MNRLVMVLLLAATGAFSAEGGPGTLTLDQAVREAVGRSPRLAALGKTRDAMRERPAQVSALPNPMFTYRGMDATSGGSFPNTTEKRFEIEQPLPGAGKRGLREAVAVKEAGVMGAEAEVMERELAFMVKEAAYELQAAREVLRITGEEAELLARMAKVAMSRYAAGEAAQADVIKAETEATMLRQKQVEWEGREKILEAKLARLMNREQGHVPETVMAPVPEGSVPDSATWERKALSARPDLAAARLKRERNELQGRLMARESRPDYKVGMEYRAIESGEDMVMFMVGVELPLWSGKNHAAVREAGLMASASEAEQEDVERQVVLDVRSACFRIGTARQTLELYRQELASQAAVRLQSSEAGYKAGKLDFSDWLESERFGLNVKIMTVMAGSDLGVGWAALERAVGGAL